MPVSSDTVTTAFLERFLLKGQMLLKNLFFLASQHFFSIKRFLETELELAESCWFSTACWVTPEIRLSSWRQAGSEEDYFRCGRTAFSRKKRPCALSSPGTTVTCPRRPAARVGNVTPGHQAPCFQQESRDIPSDGSGDLIWNTAASFSHP